MVELSGASPPLGCTPTRQRGRVNRAGPTSGAFIRRWNESVERARAARRSPWDCWYSIQGIGTLAITCCC
jgi:hypothetical protein